MHRDPFREVLLAIAFFGGLALVAWKNGLFEALGDDALILAAFAGFFAALTWTLDDGLRSAAKRAWTTTRPRTAPAKSPAAKRAAT